MASSSKRVKLASEEVNDRFLDSVDVWQVIFEMLEVKDRIRLEMTNNRLHNLMFEFWKRVTSFDTEYDLMSHKPLMSSNPDKLSAPFVSICVNRIGDRLRSLTIREISFPMDVWNATLCPIGQGCPNIDTINFVFENNDGTLHNVRFDSFPCLKTITVSSERGDFVEVSASLFLSIPPSIEAIRGLCGIDEEPFENGAQIEGFFTDRPSLREVYLGHLCTRDKSKADIFRVIAERCPHLKSIRLFHGNYIDFSGVVALDEMKELRLAHVVFDEMKIVTICERSPLLEALVFHLRFSSNLHLQSTALRALGSLTKLAELHLRTPRNMDVVVPSLVTEFVRELARNSGASLRHLYLPSEMPLRTAAIEALANGCPKLRYLYFRVRVDEVEPASIRFLIDSIVAHPSWIHQTDEPTLVIYIDVIDDGGDEVYAGLAALKALAEPATNLPSGVELNIY